jgi:uncharacterized protein YuzE
MAVMIEDWVRLIPRLRDLPAHSARITYDEQGDVLYINFEPGVEADESYEVEDDVIGRFKDGRPIGYTVLNAAFHGYK